jgi:succinyl-CoA synthetase beta subunit
LPQSEDFLRSADIDREADIEGILALNFHGFDVGAFFSAAVRCPRAIAGPSERTAVSAMEAATIATEIGYPVVLKGLMPGVVHKSDAGLVAIGLNSAADVLHEAKCMIEVAGRSRPNQPMLLLTQEQVQPLAELLVGGRVDPDFRPVVAVGSGGIMVEVYKDVAVRLAPIGPAEALEALNATKISRTLAGFRGRPPSDLQAVADAISAVSWFIADLADGISEVEINPLAVLPSGQCCRALDCVIIPRAESKHRTVV